MAKVYLFLLKIHCHLKIKMLMLGRVLMMFFFVRRSNKYWAALPPDQVIEQLLMASLKNCKSGLTHGRGKDEVQRLTWLFLDWLLHM